MKDILTEELAAIRRVREERFKQLMRDLEEGRLNAGAEQSPRGSRPLEAPSETSPASPTRPSLSRER
jgi:hypothetical protein